MTSTEEITQFLQAIDDLDVGERVALRRAAGTTLQNAATRAVSAFYKALPYTVPDWQEGRWFAAGCLHCLWDPSGEPAVPMPLILQGIRKQDIWSSFLQQRTIQLLDTRWSDQDGFLQTKLARFMKMLRQKMYRVDCGALLQDLIGWNRDNQAVQRSWASTIFRQTGKGK